MEEDIIFNDGDDLELERQETFSTLIHFGAVNNWSDPIFFVDCAEFGYGIVYDDERRNIRYSIILAERVDLWNVSDITMSKGPSWKGGTYKSTKSILLKRSKLSYKDFLVYSASKINEEASIEKIIQTVDRYTNLAVFL